MCSLAPVQVVGQLSSVHIVVFVGELKEGHS